MVPHAGHRDFPVSPGDKATRVEQIPALRHRRLRAVKHNPRLLVDRHALAGQGRLVRHELVALQETPVRGKLIPRLHTENIPHHHVSPGYQADFTVPYHLDRDILADPAQGLKSLRAPPLHHHGDHNGQGNRHKDSDTFQKIRLPAGHIPRRVDPQRDNRGNHQHDQHWLRCRLPDTVKQRFLLAF